MKLKNIRNTKYSVTELKDILDRALKGEDFNLKEADIQKVKEAVKAAGNNGVSTVEDSPGRAESFCR